jgi:hypothetical protein
MIICPYCGQDYVWIVRIGSDSTDRAMCFECDTIWDTLDDFRIGNGCNSEKYMAEYGRRVDWKEIVKIEKLAVKNGGA